MSDTILINEKKIEEVANKHLANASIFTIFFKQAVTEQLTRFRTKMSFRQSENEHAREAYRRMKIREFEGINARQSWSNWRTVPRNLSGRLPNKPIQVLDLCCGVGHSTEVLAAYLVRGSTILGLEYSPDFVKIASEKRFYNNEGQEIAARFRAQSVLETFLDVDGSTLPSNSIHLVNSCGAVGHHFDPQATALLAKEITRVVVPGGMALIDSGERGTDTETLIKIFKDLGFSAVNQAKSCFVDPYTQVCFIKTNV